MLKTPGNKELLIFGGRSSSKKMAKFEYQQIEAGPDDLYEISPNSNSKNSESSLTCRGLSGAEVGKTRDLGKRCKRNVTRKICLDTTENEPLKILGVLNIPASTVEQIYVFLKSRRMAAVRCQHLHV